MRKFTLGKSKEEVEGMLPEYRIQLTRLSEKKVCLLRIGEEVYAFEHLCPHQGAPLHQGHVNGFGELICPLHSYRFDLKTGQVKSGDCRDLEVFRTKLTEDGLEIFL